MRNLNSTSAIYLMMQDGEWENVAHVVIASGFRGILDMSGATNEQGLNILHSVCRFQPPEELVEFILQQRPNLAHEADCWGCYPLHYAARHGSRSAVVKALLAENPSAAMHADKEGRLPLHHACRPREWVDVSEQMFQGEEQEIYEMQPGSAVIMAICDVAPESTNVEDRDGYNALELAIEFDLSEKICETLMKASDKAWKEMKKQKEVKDAERRRSRHILEAEQRRILRDLPSTSQEMIKKLWHKRAGLRDSDRVEHRGESLVKMTPSREHPAPTPQVTVITSQSFTRANTSIKGVNEFVSEAPKAPSPIDDSYRTTTRCLAA